MPSWDVKVRQLRRTSRGESGCLRGQEGGTAGSQGVALAIPEAPEKRTAVTQGEEEGEAEVTELEEEGTVQAGMEMEE